MFDMHRLNLETGEISLEVENPGDVLGWACEDTSFTIKAATAINSADSSQIVRVREALSSRCLLLPSHSPAPCLRQVLLQGEVLDAAG